MQLLKWCRYCKKYRSFREFDGHALKRDGIAAACRTCREERPELARPQIGKLKRWHS